MNLENLQIDDQVDAIEEIFKYSVKESTHKAKRQTRYLPRHIMDIIRERKSLLMQRRRVTSQAERTELTKKYNKVNRAVKKLIQEFEHQQRERLAWNICVANDSNQMWKLFNKFKNKDKDCEKPTAPLELENGEVAVTNKERCSEFARHLEGVHQTPDNPEFDVNFKNEVDSFFATYQQPPPCEDGIGQIGVQKFRELLAQTKSNSSPGDDCITYDVMKQLGDKSKATLCKLINNCLSKNVFPTKWKCAKLIMLPKPGKDPKKSSELSPN